MNGIPVALGTADFGTAVSQEDAFGVLDTYAALGGRTIDTANSYAFWHPAGKGGDSETVIGNWLERVDRSAFAIMTKVGSHYVTAPDGTRTPEGLSPDAVHSAVAKSLARLRTGYIDILLAHHDDRRTPLEDTWRAFSALVTAGKVRHVGISNYSPQRVEELTRIVKDRGLAPVDVVQLKYSVIEPARGTDFGSLVLLDDNMKATLKRCLPNAMLFGYSPLLGGKVFEDVEGVQWPAGYDSAQNRHTVRQIQAKAMELGVSPSAYVLKQIADQGIWPVTATGNAARMEAYLRLFRAKNG